MSTSRSRVIFILFRNDFRLLDNECFAYGHKNADFVVPVYCFDPRHYKGTYHYDLPKTGPHRLKFLIESIRDVRKSLTERGSDLVVRSGRPEDVLPGLIQQLGPLYSSQLVYQQEATKEETDVEKALQAKCGVPVQSFWGATLFHKDDVPFEIKNLPDVYTQFRKQVEGACRVRKVFEIPKQLKPLPPGLEPGDLPSYTDLGVQEPTADPRCVLPFEGGETVALARLKHYLWDTDCVAAYKETRNGMIGADYSTKFSAWLAHGCISPRHIYWEIKRYERERTSNQSTYWVIFELIWRDYFRFVALKYGNRLFYPSGLLGKHIDWKTDMNQFAAWKEGRTGVPFVDANMREVLATGFMSNRGRQNVASFLTKDLKLDWRLGAEWFESQLVDHDVCSNYGNWLYSAGIGNDPRENRKFNVIKQGLDYDAEGAFVRLWVPELKGLNGGCVHTPWMQSAGQLSKASVSLGETYPNPIVTAPEWNKHAARSGPPRGGSGGGARGRGRGGPPRSGQNRGMDFYFKGGQHGGQY